MLCWRVPHYSAEACSGVAGYAFHFRNHRIGEYLLEKGADAVAGMVVAVRFDLVEDLHDVSGCDFGDVAVPERGEYMLLYAGSDHAAVDSGPFRAGDFDPVLRHALNGCGCSLLRLRF